MENIIVSEVEEVSVAEKTSRFDAISYYILLALVFLLPVFFIPSSYVPYELGKSAFIAGAIIVSFVCYLAARFKDGKISIPKTGLFFSAVSIPIVFLISALIQGTSSASYLGQGYELGTVSNVALMLVLLFLISTYARDLGKVVKFYSAAVISFFLVTLLHLVRFAFPGSLSFGLLNDATANFIGKWNDLGIYFGMLGLISYLTLEFMIVKKGIRNLLYVVSLISLVFIILVNFDLAWYALGIVGLIVFALKFMRSRTEDGASKRVVSKLAIALVVISALFLIVGDKVVPPIASKLSVGQIEVRPSWSATMQIFGKSKASEMIIGSGPNRFVNQYYKSKPTDINSTIFWNAGFIYGIGLIPTYLVTTGILGLLAWIAFLAFFLWRGIRMLMDLPSNPLLRYVSASSFLISFYLWFLAVFYVPSLVISTLTFIFTGIFLASLLLDGKVNTIEVMFRTAERRKTIAAMVGITVVVAGCFVWFFSYASRVVSAVYFQNAIASYSKTGDLVETERNIMKSISWKESGVQYQSLSELAISRMAQIVSSSKNLKDQGVVNQLQQLLAYANFNAQKASAYDSTDYQNWLTKARVAESVLPLGVPDAYSTAIDAYKKAIEANPTNPSLYLMVARLEAATGNYDEAQKWILEAIKLKNNYTDAIFSLAQVQVASGKLNDAIRTAQVGVQVSPSDPQSYYLLGLLLYNAKDYSNTVLALGKAVELNSQYSNARYFLGLSLSRLGKNQDALAQFEEIQKLNPDNAEIAQIISNLKAGRSALAETAAPAPEKRPKPPVKDATEKKNTASLKATVPANNAN